MQRTWGCWDLGLWGSRGSVTSQRDGTAYSYTLCPFPHGLVCCTQQKCPPCGGCFGTGWLNPPGHGFSEFSPECTCPVSAPGLHSRLFSGATMLQLGMWETFRCQEQGLTVMDPHRGTGIQSCHLQTLMVFRADHPLDICTHQVWPLLRNSA